MNKIFSVDPWEVTEVGRHESDNRWVESIMSLGNGHMGMRGNFEEDYSGDSLQGTYIAGVYYPDKTRVGWWKIGYPEYFAKVLNAANFIGIRVIINGVPLDLNRWEIKDFRRTLNMRHSYLQRHFVAADADGREYEVDVVRFLSRRRREIGAIQYRIRALGHDAEVELVPYIDGDVVNEDANFDETFWDEIQRTASTDVSCLTLRTKKTHFVVSTAMTWSLNAEPQIAPDCSEAEKYVQNSICCALTADQWVELTKFAAVTTSRDWPAEATAEKALELAAAAHSDGWDCLMEEHQAEWEKTWLEGDVTISGDDSAQQGVRFNILQLHQTYTGEDPRLNIGPKGFTGEKYGGSTYWDTEAYCLPFYLSTMDAAIARNLLIYRHNHLQKAVENAAKLGCKGALYPMVTMNGEECHNEWEITFQEIHRNAAISYAIFHYVRYTQDTDYLADYGYDVLLETSRYWAHRATYQPRRGVYMILGVTGPNEYENNINNNWYTNTMAAWNIHYTLEVREFLAKKHPQRLQEIEQQRELTAAERQLWQAVADGMYYPRIDEYGVFAQQDGFMDKHQQTTADLKPEERPLNQHWSWDRILRSVFIKQADVLQGLFFLGDRFDQETKRRNFEFYEPMTVHESSLSPCVHAILASEIGLQDKAYEMYLRTARLDLDNYNNDTEDGLHITSMAGSWMSIVYGFGGLRIQGGQLQLTPFIPQAWDRYSFKLMFREHRLQITVDKKATIIVQEAGDPLELVLHGQPVTVAADGRVELAHD